MNFWSLDDRSRNGWYLVEGCPEGLIRRMRCWVLVENGVIRKRTPWYKVDHPSLRQLHYAITTFGLPREETKFDTWVLERDGKVIEKHSDERS